MCCRGASLLMVISHRALSFEDSPDVEVKVVPSKLLNTVL